MPTYKIQIVIEPDRYGFYAYSSGLKGVFADGKTEEEAIEHATIAAKLFIESLIEHSEPIPVGICDHKTVNSASDGEQEPRISELTLAAI